MKKINILFGILFLVATIARLFALDSPLSHDEWYTYDVVTRNFVDMNIHMYDDVHVPLYFYLLKIWLFFTGNSFIAMRLLSVLLGVLGVIFFARFAKQYFSTKTALLATAILALSGFHISYSITARMYSLLFLLVVLALHCMFDMIFTKKKYALTGFIITNILILYTHFFGIFFLLFETIVLYIYKNKLNIKKTLLGYGALIVSSIPFGLFMLIQIWRRIQGTSYADWMPQTPVRDIWIAIRAMSSNDILAYLFITLILIFFIRQIVHFKETNKENTIKKIMALGAIICFILPSIITLITPIFAWRYFFIVYPVFILIIAMSVREIFIGKLYYWAIAIILLLLTLSVMTYINHRMNATRDQEMCFNTIEQKIQEYELLNTSFVTYRWLNEWVPEHRPTIQAFEKLDEIFNMSFIHVNYYETPIDYLFENSTYIIIVSPSGWHSRFIQSQAPIIEQESCYGYSYYIHGLNQTEITTLPTTANN